ncbi:MAG: AMP-binding protein [Actinobacteria bacterium]|nr:AMP-binding protein [Actinomycetota bacterium]
MKGFLKRVAWASSRNATMANLFENLARVYGAEAMRVASPAACNYFPGGTVTHEGALRFTNLAAEALIERVDLVKGERVLVATPDAGEGLLIAAAVIKAGGVVVPALGAADDGELACLVRGCDVRVALVRAQLLDGLPRLREALNERARLVTLDGEARGAGDEPSLYGYMAGASGFFLPYTLKPSNVVLLCGVRDGGGTTRAVMVTNRGLMSPARLLAPLLPARAGGACLVCSPLTKPSLFAAAVWALAAGMSLRFPPSCEEELLRGMVEEEGPAAVAGHPRDLQGLADACARREGRRLPALWLSAGLLGDEEGGPCGRPGGRIPAGRTYWLVETFAAGENATIAGLRVSLAGRRRMALPCVPLPPNRVRCVRGDGAPAGRGEEGELALRGPAVTPGYWNDLETTFRSWRNGWLHTGMRVTRSPWGIPRCGDA